MISVYWIFFSSFFSKLLQNASSKVEEPVISSAWYSSKNKTQKTQNFPPLQPQQDNAKTRSITVSNASTYVTVLFIFFILLCFYNVNTSL